MIYFDNAAKTEITKPVLEAMTPYLTESYGNPSSLYSFGRKTRQAIETARERIAKAINAEPKQILFTSGSTESNNWVVANHGRTLCSRVEHHSILNNPHILTMDYTSLAHQIYEYRPNLVSHMFVNNETSEMYDIKSMCDISHKMKVPLHTDATAAFSHTPVDVKNLNVDYLSLSGGKFHAPSGVGILYAKDPATLKPMLYGGSQEFSKRAGTENVASIVAMGKAAELYDFNVKTNNRVKELREHLKRFITDNISNVLINEPKNHTDNILSVSFKGLESESIMLLLDREGICVSSGSACNSGSLEPSHVLKEFGIPGDYIYGTIRFSFSELNTLDEIIQTETVLKDIIRRLRGEK